MPPPSAGRLVGAAKDAARRLRRSPKFWVLASTLLPALVCTLLDWAYASSLWQLVLYFWYSISEIHKWMVSNLLSLKKAFDPYLKIELSR